VPYEYLDEASIADVAFRAWGEDAASCFAAAAAATLNVMVEDLATVRPVLQRTVELERDALDMLLFAFLNEIVYLKDAERMLLLTQSVRIDPAPAHCRLRAVLAGEELDLARHTTRVDVKAVTLHGFSLQQLPQGWEARVTLDV
jgi:SHS2 domain-containing protein